MKPRGFISLLFMFALGAANGTGQVQELSGDQYLQEYTEALVKSQETPRRHRETTEWFNGTTVTERESSILEVDADANTRFKHESKKGAKTTIFETISVGGITYCRTNGRRWQVTSECGTGANFSAAEMNTISEYYSKQVSVLDGVDAVLFRAYSKFRKLDSLG